MARPRPLPTLLLLVPLLAAACSGPHERPLAPDDASTSPDTPASQSAAGLGAPTRAELPVAGADAGLEASMFLSTADEIDFAAAVLPYADQATPFSAEARELWSAHGLRALSVPIAEVDALTAALRPAGPVQRQWLGQAYSWTEVARGAQSASPRTVALDAERIRLEPGTLRLLVRSWLEPAPRSTPVGAVKVGERAGAEPQDRAPAAILRTEIVPQNQELRPAAGSDAELSLAPPSIAPETQGMLFARLYARATMTPGRALVIVPERPGASWREQARRTRPPLRPDDRQTPDDAPHAGPVPAYDHDNQWTAAVEKARPAEPIEPAEPPRQPESTVGESAPQGPAASKPSRPAAPGVGVVTREPKDRPRADARRTPADAPPEPTSRTTGPAGPAAVRTPSLGEAMLMRAPTPGAEADAVPIGEPARAVIILVPRVPAEFRLLAN